MASDEYFLLNYYFITTSGMEGKFYFGNRAIKSSVSERWGWRRHERPDHKRLKNLIRASGLYLVGR